MLVKTPSLSNARYRVTLGPAVRDMADVLSLRARAFGAQAGKPDRFDEKCDLLLVHDSRSGDLVCSARVLLLRDARKVKNSYSAQYYDLSALTLFPGRMTELGRFCIDPARHDADILRVAWAALTAYVDENRSEILFGCSSFVGTGAGAYLDAFALLRARHLAPGQWCPRVKAPEVFAFGTSGTHHLPDMRRALRTMPPLLRSYLMMGGWVSDHAVVDRQMNTLHVFTGLEIAAIPENRKRLLRMAAGDF